LIFTSCATLFNPKGKIQIPVIVENSNEYEVSVNEIPLGMAEFITVQKGDIVTVTANGKTKSVTQIQGKFNTWALGNLIFGGVVGIIVDYSTGHINEVTTLKIIATLEDEN
jgi:hypothetical protein